VHQHSLATAITNAFAHYALVVMWAHENHPNEYFTAKQVKEVRLCNGKGSRIPKRWRWRLFHALSAYSGSKEPVEEGEGRNKRSAKVVHRVGELKVEGHCAKQGCEGRSRKGCHTCDMAFCYPKCLDRHLQGKCKHKSMKAGKKWEELPDLDHSDYEEGSTEGNSGTSGSDSLSGSASDSD
jgi:hypothetical protein